MKVLLFASLHEAVGKSELLLELPDASPVGGLIARLEREHPILKKYLPYVQVAVNYKLVHGKAVLRDGDEIALLPPVGGG